LSKWVYDTSIGAAIRAGCCGSFVEGAMVSWSLAMDERDGHCRYPEYRVPAYKLQVKTKDKARTRARVPQGPGSRLPAWGSSGVVACPRGFGSRLSAAPGLPHVRAAPAPVSRFGAAPGPPRVAWAPAPDFCLREAPKLPRVPRMGSTSCKQLNKYPLTTRSS
jgi:hypothetical protein